AAAAALPKPQNLQLKPARDFQFIGKSLPRLDTASKVDGSAQFGIDVHLPGMVYAALAQPPVLGGKLKSFDDSKAKGMPGVHAVLATSNGVAVVADGWWQARQARDALSIQWDAGSNAKLNNAAISAALKSANGPVQSVRREGDVDAAMKVATRRVEAVYELPM